MTKDEAMKLALEALECTEYPQDHYDAITALREALAEQPAQQHEPVATVCSFGDLGGTFDWASPRTYRPPVGAKLYASPPAQRTWVGLTDKEKREARNAVSYSPLAMTMGECTEAVQNATEAKLKEKNT